MMVRLLVFPDRLAGIDLFFLLLFALQTVFGFLGRRRAGSGDILVMQKMLRELRFVEPMEWPTGSSTGPDVTRLINAAEAN